MPGVSCVRVSTAARPVIGFAKHIIIRRMRPEIKFITFISYIYAPGAMRINEFGMRF
jgi:hypothetical protein